MFFSRAPFYVVLLASALPWVAAVANSKLVTYLPDALAGVAYALFAGFHPERAFRIRPFFAVVLLLVVFHVIFGVFSGRGIGSAGMASLFILTFVFSKLLDNERMNNSASEHLATVITRQIGLIYIVHTLFILAELLVRLGGYTDVLVDIAGHATEVTKYKTGNSANFLNYIGISDISGMNSMLLGSQSASQLVLFTAFWFAPMYMDRSLLRTEYLSKRWFLLAVILFPFVTSMTAMALLALLVLFMVYVLPNSVLNRPVFWVSVPLLALVFSQELVSLFAYRIQNERDIEIYLTDFMDAPLRFMDLPLTDKIMGFRSHIREAPLHATDFGLATLVYQAGAFLIGLALLCLVLIVSIGCYEIRRSNSAVFPEDPWAVVAALNVVCAIGWAASLVHYTPALELGGRHLFAMHLAVCLVSIRALADRRRVDFQTK